MEFFDEKQGAAEFKHALLREYVPIFANKVGSVAAGHRVHLLDGYAGPGWYEDQSPGSPALLLKTATDLAANRSITCWFVEEDAGRYRRLRDRVAASSSPPGSVQTRKGKMEHHVPEIVGRVSGDPLFAFVDPFGIGLPFDCLVNGLLHRGAGTPTPKTEVLVSFIRAGVYRNAGRLTQVVADPRQAKVAEQVLPQLDANLGGPWWRDIWRAYPSIDGVCAIRDEYIRRVLAAAGRPWSCYPLPVADSPSGAPVYDMLLFTRSPQGLWFFNEAVSLTREHAQEEPAQGRIWTDSDGWVQQIRLNLARMLPAGGRPFKVIDRMHDVYGDTLGFARAKHVRQALTRLAADGVIVSPTKGDVPTLLLVPAPRRDR